MMFVHASGVHSTLPQGQQPDLAAELKAMTGKFWRRTDHYIQLALLGAHKAVREKKLPENTALYLTSGQGNISVFERICEQRRNQNLLPKPVDFINLLSNSAGFYLASHLGLEGKNIFVTHHNFPVQMALLAAQNDLRLGKQEMALVGGVDEWIPEQELACKLLGVPPETSLGEASNWILLSGEAADNIPMLEIHPQPLGLPLLRALLAYASEGTFVAFSHRVLPEDAARFMRMYRQCREFTCEKSGYYETLPLLVVNSFLASQKGRLIHVDGCNDSYMVMTVTSFDNGKKPFTEKA
jgi:hypothetical protein